MGDLGVTLAINNEVALSDTSHSVETYDLDVVKFSITVALMVRRSPAFKNRCSSGRTTLF